MECQHKKMNHGEITEMCGYDRMPHIRHAEHCQQCGATEKEIKLEKELQEAKELINLVRSSIKCDVRMDGNHYYLENAESIAYNIDKLLNGGK